MPAAPKLPPADFLLQRLTWDDLDLAHLRRLIEMARAEDLEGLGLRANPSRIGDLSSVSVVAASPRTVTADLVARESLVVCGLQLVPLILSVYGGRATVQPRARDGARIAAGAALATLSGDPRILLAAERVILNFLQRHSGVATNTRHYVEALGHTRTRLLDTRKTTPGYRMLEKYAVACGGGWNHRLGLFDRVMFKDNHLALLGSADGLAAAVASAKKAAPELPVEIEGDSLKQIPSALAAGADIVLFDNFTPAQLRRAIASVGGRAFTEASGGINFKTLPRLAGLGLDFISTGALVHQSVWVDIGLDWR
ncbi:MAG: carboxylating nicotinate-nucleotide diphosphorylase [Verrucomicrobiota bacterium]|nr:carboxylating nicotinate-nucleotide diphosphorylase [Verrucomicrobiota bacterium]